MPYLHGFTPTPPRGAFLLKTLFKACLIVIVTFVTVRQAVTQDTGKPYRTIKIGLLIPDNNSRAALYGAEMAIDRANKAGGLNGCPFQLVFRSMEGPWGTGSKQAVNLIFEEKVWALLGSHDGRNAHLVEQAATKSTVVFVSAWSGDPTLSQAFVPWFFNCVPNDHQQAVELIEEISHKPEINKMAVIYSCDYDSKLTLDNFLKTAKMSGIPDPYKFCYEDYNNDLKILTDKINEADADCLVLFCKPSVSSELMQLFVQKKMNQPVFGSISLLNENELSARKLNDYDNVLSVPSGDWSGPENKTFRMEFQKTYGKQPGMVASYSFDGMSILIEAIRNSGSPDREKIQKSLENICYKGVTGTIQFDDKGNRKGSFKIMKTKNGIPATRE